MTDDGKRKRSHWSATDRDLAGEKHRRTNPFGMQTIGKNPTPVPAAEIDEEGEVTSPIEMLLRELTEHELVVAHELAERGLETNTAAQLAKVLVRVQEIKSEERTHNRARANDVLDVARVADTEGIAQDRAKITQLAGRMRIVWGLLIALGTAATGSLVAVGKGLYESGEHEGALKYRLDVMERDIGANRSDIHDIRLRFDHAGRADTTKDTKP